MKNQSWSIYNLWNTSILEVRNWKERKKEPREILFASELGKSFIDIWYSLKGEEPSNDFSETTLRKFDAGIIWEKVLETIYKRMGILIETQKSLKLEMKGCLPVWGRLDFIVGGKLDKEKGSANLEEVKDLLPENVFETSKLIIKQLPEELKKSVLEIKSISSFMFDKYSTGGQPNNNHRIQLATYLKCLNMDEGHILYISKDDARLLELGVFNPSSATEELERFVKEFSNYWFNNIEPPKEKEIIFDEEWGRFSLNWKVVYSQYLTKIYGYKDRTEVENIFKPLVEKWNRVLGRVKQSKEMTKNNLEAIKEIKDWGFDYERIIEKLKVSQPEEINEAEL
jgi:hypothetical protein